MAFPSSRAVELRMRESGAGFEHVVPVVLKWAEALDGGIEVDHGAGHGFARRIGIKSALNGIALVKECREPARIWSGPGCRDATVLWVESKATDGINGRLYQDSGWERSGGDGKIAKVFLRTWSHAMPGA